MRYTVRELSYKRKLSTAHIRDLMQKYTTQYCRSLHELFELGITDNPYHLDEFSLREILVNDFEDEIRLLLSPIDARYRFEENNMEYAQLVSDDIDFRNILHWYADYLEAVRNLNTCEAILTKYKGNKSYVYSSVSFSASQTISVRSTYDLFPEALLDEGYGKIERYSTGRYVLQSLCENIGISAEDYQAHVSKNRALFLKGVTFEEECLFTSSITRGEILLDGDYGERLLNSIIKYWEGFKDGGYMSQMPYDGVVFNMSMSSRSSAIQEHNKGVFEKGGKLLYIDNDFVYYQYPDDKKWCLDKIYVGNYSNLDDKTSLFDGVQGLFSYERQEDSVPVFVNGYGVLYTCGDEDFYEVTYDSLYAEYDCYTEQELLNIIRKYTNSELVAELVLASLYTRCGNYCFRFRADMTDVTYDTYIDARKEAVQIVQDTFSVL